MVSLEEVHASNACVASELPSGLIAVFVRATSGIGEYTLKQFAKHARRPRIYFVGRSKEAGERIATECKASNPEGSFTFIRADVSLIRTVDEVCNDIKHKEDVINLLFLSAGVIVKSQDTYEKLPLMSSVVYYSRTRFMVNLLPHLRRATGLRRVVTTLASSMEGPINTTNLPGRNLNLLAWRDQIASMITLSLEALAKEAPNVSFIHNCPPPVKSKLFRGLGAPGKFFLKLVFMVVGPLVYVPPEECGDRHVFLMTSARYPPGRSGDSHVAGVPLQGPLLVTDGQVGSGAYAIDDKGESAAGQIEGLFAMFRSDGTADRVWRHTQEVFSSIRQSGHA